MNGSAYVAALRMLAQRRLTEAQLFQKLARKSFPEADILAAIERCKTDGFIDDRLFAQLYVEQKRKSVGDARLVGELVQRGIDREAASLAVRRHSRDESCRLQEALTKLLDRKPRMSYPSAARALERLGFPAASVYTTLRRHAAQFGPLADLK